MRATNPTHFIPSNLIIIIVTGDKHKLYIPYQYASSNLLLFLSLMFSSFITYYALRQIGSLFQSQFSAERDPVLPPSVSSNPSFP